MANRMGYGLVFGGSEGDGSGGIIVPASAIIPFATIAARNTWASMHLGSLIANQTAVSVTTDSSVTWYLWRGATDPDTHTPSDWLDATPILDGPRGLTGARGLQGIQGMAGPLGMLGGTGARGDKGDKGDSGDKGAQGEQGGTGDQGAAGNIQTIRVAADSGVARGSLRVDATDTANPILQYNLASTSTGPVDNVAVLYYGLISTGNAIATTPISSLTRIDPTGRQRIETGQVTQGQFFAILVPSANELTSIRDTALDTDVTTIFIKTPNIRQVDSVGFTSYVVGPLNAFSAPGDAYVIEF